VAASGTVISINIFGFLELDAVIFIICLILGIAKLSNLIFLSLSLSILINFFKLFSAVIVFFMHRVERGDINSNVAINIFLSISMTPYLFFYACQPFTIVP
jgi:hypothetical protein